MNSFSSKDYIKWSEPYHLGSDHFLYGNFFIGLIQLRTKNRNSNKRVPSLPVVKIHYCAFKIIYFIFKVELRYVLYDMNMRKIKREIQIVSLNQTSYERSIKL